MGGDDHRDQRAREHVRDLGRKPEDGHAAQMTGGFRSEDTTGEEGREEQPQIEAGQCHEGPDDEMDGEAGRALPCGDVAEVGLQEHPPPWATPVASDQWVTRP